MKTLMNLGIGLCILLSASTGWAIGADDLIGAGINDVKANAITNARKKEILTVTNNDAQNNTISVAELVGGITVHTSVTGGGTATTDTAVAIIGGDSGQLSLSANGQCYLHHYINDGDQTVTLAGGTDVTISDTGQTIAANEAALLVVCRTAATTVTVYVIGG